MKIENLKDEMSKAARAIYIQCPEQVADHISQILITAKARITGLEQERKILHQENRTLRNKLITKTENLQP